jgi:peptide/nickel transport system substrate-binding protein
VLRVAVRADVRGFFPNPPFANEAYSVHVNSNVFEGLVGFDPNLRLIPALAARWENPDASTYLFELEPGLRFSDGRPVTAADVVASLKTAMERRWALYDYLRAIVAVKARGERQVEIRTGTPDLILLFRLPWGFVLPADALGQDPVPVIGTGPYRLESWVPGQEFTFVRNPFHRGPEPDFAKARFLVTPDGRARVARVLQGEADLADQVPLEAVSELQKRDDVTVVLRSSLRVLFLGLRVDRQPFSDPRVREAVDLAIDRGALAARALLGYAEPATQVVPRTVVGYNPRLPGHHPDPARARRLLAAAGYSEGLELRLDGPNNRYVNDVAILEELARQLRLAGMRVSVHAMDKQPFFALLDGAGSQAHLFGWACESGDAGNVLDAVFHSKGEGIGSSNFAGLADPELDRLIGAANAATTLTERTALLQSAVARVAELRPVIPLVVQAEALLLSRRIHWEPSVNLALRVAEIGRAVSGSKAP